MDPQPVIGLTMGNPAGIGPELCLRALGEPSVLAQGVPLVFGDSGILERVAAAAGLRFRGRVVSLADWEASGMVKEPTIVDCAALRAEAVRPGVISAACGKAAFTCIERAIRAAQVGHIAGVVTAPLHKESLSLAGVPYPGHTEIFTALTGARRSCMMLRSEVLTVSMVTTHVGYAEVPQQLSVQRVLDVVELTAEALHRLQRRPPRLGVCGLNPHAGEHGLFGHEEEEQFVAPAVRQAREEGISVDGPLVPDAAFTPAQRRRFDALVCLYHDQGHIPFKMLAFDTGVNITLGLPIVRTSVDHGTAFDIAWKGEGSPQSLFAAIRAALALARGRPNRGVSQ